MAGARGVSGPGRPNGSYGYGYAAPRGSVAYAGNRYGAAYYNNGRYYGGRYYGGYYGYHYVAPVHYVTPYYHFHPWYSIGFGISIGYPVAWSYPYYYPPYYPDPYAYAYPYPYAYPYAAPYGAAVAPTYPTYEGAYPTGGSAYPSQYPTGTTGSVSLQHTPSQQNSGGVSFEITPASADLFVDGAHIGVVGQFTPQSQPLGLSAGHHRIEIKAPGYQTVSIDADIVVGQVIPYQGTMQRQ
jgi:hypothetical protein